VIPVIVVVALIAGSALAIMNKASNNSYYGSVHCNLPVLDRSLPTVNATHAKYQALCAPIFTLRHHYSAGCLITTADLRYRGDRHLL